MNLAPLPVEKFFGNDGRPLNGGLLFTYVASTSTKIATYTDSTGGTPNTNPVVLDFRGEANIWLDPTLTYKFVLSPRGDTDPPTNPIWSVDNVTAALGITTLTQQFIGQILYPPLLNEVNPINLWYPYGYVDRFGNNTTPGTTNMTTALDNCYASCKAVVRVPMRMLATSYLYTAKRVWDGSVDVLGDDSEFTILLKSGNIDGFEISGVGQQARYENFTIQATGTLGTGRGGVVTAAAHLTMRRLSFLGHGGHGLHLVSGGTSGYFSEIANIICVGNGGDGIRVENFYRVLWSAIDCRTAGGWGFNLLTPCSYHVAIDITCQQNTSGGSQIAGQQNRLGLYGEANTGPDISLTATSVRNIITNDHVDTYPGDLQDAGTDNIWISMSGFAGVFTPVVSRPKSTTNIAGRPVVVQGGAAGSGANGVKGGKVTIQSGDADGNTLVDGEDTDVNGGSGATGGVIGRVRLNAGGGVALYGADEIGLRAPKVSAEAAGRTLALADSDKTLYFTGGAGQTFTIPANGSVAFPVGTEITIINNGTACSIAITTDTLVLIGTGATGTRTLSAAPGRAHLKKAVATAWFVDGTGIT